MAVVISATPVPASVACECTRSFTQRPYTSSDVKAATQSAGAKHFSQDNAEDVKMRQINLQVDILQQVLQKLSITVSDIRLFIDGRFLIITFSAVELPKCRQLGMR